MNELLFFVLGLVIGGLSGLSIMCMIQINRYNKYFNNNRDNYSDDEQCEQEK